MQPVKLWLPPTRDGPPLGRTRQGTEDSVELAMAHLEDWDAGPPLGEKSWEKKLEKQLLRLSLKATSLCKKPVCKKISRLKKVIGFCGTWAIQVSGGKPIPVTLATLRCHQTWLACFFHLEASILIRNLPAMIARGYVPWIFPLHHHFGWIDHHSTTINQYKSYKSYKSEPHLTQWIGFLGKISRKPSISPWRSCFFSGSTCPFLSNPGNRWMISQDPGALALSPLPSPLEIPGTLWRRDGATGCGGHVLLVESQ